MLFGRPEEGADITRRGLKRVALGSETGLASTYWGFVGNKGLGFGV